MRARVSPGRAALLAIVLGSLAVAPVVGFAASKPPSGAHGAEGGEGAHGEHGHEINWFHGLLGEKAGVEPSWLWRPPGTPVPYAASLFNTLLLFGLIYKFARAPVASGLLARRDRIRRGMDDAAAMEREALDQLAAYKHKIEHLDDEIERVRREMREGAEAERRRVLEEAEARRVRLEQEARVLVQQEFEALREQLTRETALAAVRSARELLQAQTSSDDHRRLCDEYLETLRPGALGNGAAGAGSQPARNGSS